MTKRVYITTPIYYASDVPHLGHAYTTIVADVLARYARMRGRDVRLLTGTDDHGQKIELAAARRGVSPKQYTDEVAEAYRACWRALGISNDDFIRTTDSDHEQVVRDLWCNFVADGWIELQPYRGLYCVACEQFYPEKELLRQGDSYLCAVHRQPVETVEEDNYFFKLSVWQKPLQDFYDLTFAETGQTWVHPALRMNEVRAVVDGGLADLSVSRTSSTWGIAVPGDPQHVIYVWLDALVNYYSATRRPALAGFWDDDVEIIHLVGKEITRFHAVYWPAFLQAMGLRVPSKIIAHGWWTVNGEKMSKTRGNVVDPLVLAADIGADAFRYFLLREVPLGSDGDFNHRRLIERYNAELANDLGNLVNRTVSMAAKYLPAGVRCSTDQDGPLPCTVLVEQVAFMQKMRQVALSEALDCVWKIVREANAYVDEMAPWKQTVSRQEVILWNLLETCRVLGHMLSPFMPERAGALLRQIGADEPFSFPAFGDRVFFQPAPATPIFPRIDAEKKVALLSKWAKGL